MKFKLTVLIIILMLITIYLIYTNFNENFSSKLNLNNDKLNISSNPKINAKMCIFRILGNNLNSVHSDTQTYTNLKFTLENEAEFENCDKIWILNRIIDSDLQEKYKKLLDKYNKKYLIIPFEKDEYNKIKSNNNINLNELNNNKNDNNKIFRKLYSHSLYLININGARNYCLNYGRQRYLYSFVLDGSCFFTKEQFNDLVNNINDDTEYLIIPLIRLDKNDNNVIIKDAKKYEPQIGFKNTSKLYFNEKLPYGLSNKTELLRVLKISGEWDNWLDNKNVLNISDRSKVDAKTQLVSSVCRLSNGTNKKQKNHTHRSNGLLQLVNDVEKIVN